MSCVIRPTILDVSVFYHTSIDAHAIAPIDRELQLARAAEYASNVPPTTLGLGSPVKRASVMPEAIQRDHRAIRLRQRKNRRHFARRVGRSSGGEQDKTEGNLCRNMHFLTLSISGA